MGNCVVSDKVIKNGALLSAVEGKRTYFVGDPLPITSGSKTRLGKRALDKLKVEAGNEVIQVKYVDERPFCWLFRTHS